MGHNKLGVECCVPVCTQPVSVRMNLLDHAEEEIRLTVNEEYARRHKVRLTSAYTATCFLTGIL